MSSELLKAPLKDIIKSRIKPFAVWTLAKIILIILGIIFICIYTYKTLDAGKKILDDGGQIDNSYPSFRHKVLWGDDGTTGTLQYISNIVYYTLLASVLGYVLKSTYATNKDLIEKYIIKKNN